MWNRISKGLWWDEGIELVSGCTKVSDACKYCWSLEMDKRFNKPTKVEFHEERLKRFRKKKPTVFAVWNDLFHENISFEEIDKATYAMGVHPEHIFLILTKRPERLLEYSKYAASQIKELGFDHVDGKYFEFPNFMWVGTTVENQRTADERIPLLLQTPASKRFLSVEPMLGNINLMPFLLSGGWTPSYDDPDNAGLAPMAEPTNENINWVIIGCESGTKRRETKIEWVESLVDQCKLATVPVFVKQLEINGKVEKDITKFPKHLQIREIPK